jgi:hypothetical protein
MQLAVGKGQLALPLQNLPCKEGEIDAIQLNINARDIGQIDELGGFVASRTMIQTRKVHASGLQGVIFFMRSANAHVSLPQAITEAYLFRL